jgi:hypothetical protein
VCVLMMLIIIIMFIGTQFSNLYTAVDTPARGSVGSLASHKCSQVEKQFFPVHPIYYTLSDVDRDCAQSTGALEQSSGLCGSHYCGLNFL